MPCGLAVYCGKQGSHMPRAGVARKDLSRTFVLYGKASCRHHDEMPEPGSAVSGWYGGLSRATRWWSARLKCRSLERRRRGVSAHHARAELREGVRVPRRARMVRFDSLALRLGRKAERQRHVEVGERRHLPIEPRVGIRSQAIGPAQSRPHVAHAGALEPRDRLLEPMIFE